MNYLLAAGALATAIVSPAVQAADALSDAQKTQIEQVVHDYLVKNPEVLIEASQALQKKQQENMQTMVKGAIAKNADAIFNDNYTVVGNPKGNVTLVEFFDYQCVHCKKMSPVINDLLKQDSNLRVVYKEFPIFGASSEMASQAALAAAMQGKYKAMHNALLKLDKRLNDKMIFDTAKSVGLNVDQLKKDMKSDKVLSELKENRLLAEKMRLMGTPAFIIAATPGGKYKTDDNPKFIPGAASLETLQNEIKSRSAAQ